MAQYTRPGYFGFPAGWNDSDFEITGTPAAVGQWTRLGYFGTAAGWNGVNFAVPETTATKRVALDAVVTGTVEPFDEWSIRAMIPAWVAGAVGSEQTRINIDVDRIRGIFASPYRIRGEWV